MVNAASVPIYRWHLCGHFSFRLHWVLIVFGFSGPCQPNETKIDNCMDNCMDNQMVIHTRLTLDEIRVCYYYFFYLTVYTNKFRQRSFWGGMKRKNFKFSIAPSNIEFAEENWGTRLEIAWEKEDTILCL